jgi:hypothetical protein
MPRRRAKQTKPQPKAPRVAMRLPTGPDGLYVRCDAVWTAIKADQAHFPNPYPPASVIDADLAALATALQNAENGGPAEMAALVAADSKVRGTFGLLGKYAESALRALPITDVPAILASVGMYQSNLGTRPPKPELDVQQPSAGAPVVLSARAVPGAVMYYWEQSGDTVSWSASGHGPQARFSATGLAPGKVYAFRFYALLRDGTQSPYPQPVSILVK